MQVNIQKAIMLNPEAAARHAKRNAEDYRETIAVAIRNGITFDTETGDFEEDPTPTILSLPSDIWRRLVGTWGEEVALTFVYGIFVDALSDRYYGYRVDPRLRSYMK